MAGSAGQMTAMRSPAVAGRAGTRPAASPARPQLASRISSPRDPAEREAVAVARHLRQLETQAPGRATAGATGGAAVAFRPEGAPSLARFAASMSLMRQARGEPVLDREAAGPVEIGPALAAQVSSEATGGAPLPAEVRHAMEPRFGADFGEVRVHTDDRAASLSAQLGAHAFTQGQHIHFGRDRFQPGTADGRELIAHELTHTIQQGAVVQAPREGGTASGVAVRSQPALQRLSLGDLPGALARLALRLPGFRLLTLVLGVNPIDHRPVERSAPELLRALVELVPGGGLVSQALDRHGLFEKAGSWVAGRVAALGLSSVALEAAVRQVVGSLGLGDLLDPGAAWERAKAVFSEPIARLAATARSLAAEVVGLVREAILLPLARLADGTRGYPLLRALLGRDPLTGQPAEQSAEALVGGTLRLVGQEALWEDLQRARAGPRALAWVRAALSGLRGLVAELPVLVGQVLRSLTLEDLLLLPRAFARVAGAFGGFVERVVGWAGAATWSLLELLFEVVAPAVVPYLRKAGVAFRTILRDPIAFVGNLVRAGRLGFEQFSTNFVTHLKAGLVQWLTGALAGTAVYVPQALEFREILKFVLSALGLTWANVRTRLVKTVGETAVKALETGFELVATLVTEGPAAAWEKVKEQLSNLKAMVIEEIQGFVAVKVVQAAVVKVVSMLNPAGAVIQAIMAIYNTVLFFVERLKQLSQVGMALIDALAAIAAGTIGPAASRVERTLGGLLSLAIGFLARLVGLGNIGQVVTRVLDRVRAPVERALDRIAEWIVAAARKVGRLVAAGAQKVGAWWTSRKRFKGGDGGDHQLYLQGEGQAATLTVASTPMPLSELLRQVPASDAAATGARERARAIGAEIEALVRSIPAGGSPTAGQKARLDELWMALAEHTAPLFLPSGKSSPPSYGDVTPAGFGAVMLAARLVRPVQAGSPPSVTGNRLFEALNRRRSGRGSYYVLGHLLNQRLGGPGDTWRNLTPLSRTGNSQHELVMERQVKRAVLDEGKAVRYEVLAVYGRRRNTAVLSLLTKSPPVPGAATIRDIVEAEEFIPSKLTMRAKEIGPGKGKSAHLDATAEVENRIEDSDPRDYQTGTTPRLVRLGIRDAIARGDAAALQHLPGIGEARALALIAAGSVSKWDDLLKVPGITPTLIARWQAADMKPLVSFDGGVEWA